MTTLHDFGGVLGQPLDTFFNFGLSQFHGHGSWFVWEVTLNTLEVTLGVQSLVLKLTVSSEGK